MVHLKIYLSILWLLVRLSGVGVGHEMREIMEI